MQFRNKITIVRNVRIHHLVCLIQGTKRSCSQFRGCGQNGKKNTQTTGKAIQLLLHGIQFVSEHLEPLKHRATAVAGKPVSVLRGIAEKNVALPSFLVVCSGLV